MVTAVFTDNDDYARAYGLWQWDYGQQLRIEGLHLPTAVEIHFALQETGGEAIPRVGTTKDGVTTVTIPDSMLEGNRATWTADKAYNIYAWVYLSDKSSGETIKRITMQVKSRPKPKAFEAPEDGEIFREAIEAVNDAAKRAEEAGDKAVSAADEAKAAATQTAEHLQVVQGLAEQVETNADTVAQDKQTVTGMLSQTQQAASDAALSAQAAKLSETAAAQAQTGAEAAEDTARQYAEETGADRQAVANDRQAVSQMREAVAADRKAVEQTALQFGQTSQDALTAIGQAQSTAVGAVSAEGQRQATAVQQAGTQAVSDVGTAKTEAVQAVTTEGDTQTKRVQDAAAGIVADREQISQNKTDIAGLAEGMTDLAPAIRSTVSGSVITADDAAEGRPFRGLRVFGRTEQVQTTGAQLINTQGAGNSRGVDWVFDKGVVTFSGVTVDTSTNRVNCAVNVKDVMEIGKTYFAKSFTVGVIIDIAVEKPSGVIYTREYTPDGTETGIRIRVLVDKSNDAGIEIDLTAYVAITENERLSSWEPYTGGKPSPSPEYPQEIESAGDKGNLNVMVRGKNIFPGPEQPKTVEQNGLTFSYKDGMYTLTGTSNENTWFNIYPVIDKTTSISPTHNGNAICSDGKIAVVNGLKNKLCNIAFRKVDNKNSTTVITASNNKKMLQHNASGVFIYAPPGSYSDTFTLMITGENQTEDYEPYHTPQTLTLSTQNGLPGIPVSSGGNYTDADGQQWICDEIDLERGKYVQRVLKTKPNKTIVFTDRNENGRYAMFDNSLFGTKWMNGAKQALSSIAQWSEWGNGADGTFALAANGIYYKDSMKTLEEMNAMFAKIGTDFEVCGVLATPIERDLTPEEIAAYKALRTYGPTTVITNDAGAGMEVTYVADTKAYIDKKFKELNQAIVNTQIALL